MLELVVIIIILLLTYFYKKSRKPLDFPPGPPKLPIFGSAFSMISPHNKRPCVFWSILKFKKEYGDIFGFFLGDLPAVVLTDYNDIKALFASDNVSLRPPIPPAHKFRPGWQSIPDINGINKDCPPGVIGSNGRYWREQRRFLLKNLRDFGFGKASMESQLHVEIEKLLTILKEKDEEPLKMNRLMNISILNALWKILTGETLALNDPRLNNLMQTLDALLRLAECPTSIMANIAPMPDMLLLPVIKQLVGAHYVENVFQTLNGLIGPILEQHLADLDPIAPRDLMDLLFMEVAKTQDPTSGFYRDTGTATIVNNMMDLFLAGMETTSSSLLWSFLYLLHFPKWQSKIYEEIKAVIGTDRLPSLSDREDLPLTNAFLLEALRLTGFLPMALFHQTTHDLQLKKYKIPKNSVVISSLFLVMRDAKYFADPDDFKPERFINDQGKFVNDEHVVPFGIGKRICLGKSLADKEYFLFFTAILQSFEIKNVPGQKLPGYGAEQVPVPGLLRSVPEFELMLKARH